MRREIPRQSEDHSRVGLHARCVRSRVGSRGALLLLRRRPNLEHIRRLREALLFRKQYFRREVRRRVRYNFTIGASLTWQYVTVTIPAPPVASAGTWELGSGAASGIGLKLYIGSWLGSNLPASGGWSNSYSVGTTASSTWFTTIGNYVEFTGVQLEKGSTNTPFEFRPYAVELQLCQRYYAKIINYPIGLASGNNVLFGGGVVALPCTMRAPPSIDALQTNTFGVNTGQWLCGAIVVVVVQH